MFFILGAVKYQLWLVFLLAENTRAEKRPPGCIRFIVHILLCVFFFSYISYMSMFFILGAFKYHLWLVFLLAENARAEKRPPGCIRFIVHILLCVFFFSYIFYMSKFFILGAFKYHLWLVKIGRGLSAGFCDWRIPSGRSFGAWCRYRAAHGALGEKNSHRKRSAAIWKIAGNCGAYGGKYIYILRRTHAMYIYIYTHIFMYPSISGQWNEKALSVWSDIEVFKISSICKHGCKANEFL